MKDLKLVIKEHLNETQIKQIINIGNEINDKIEGGFLTKKEVKDLEKEIENKYFNKRSPFNSDDIRQNIFNYDNPLAEKDINGINLKIAGGLLENDPISGKKRKTYLLYANGKIIGKFYHVNDIKKVIKYIENTLVKQ
jgi:hypothetical protein